MKWFLLFFYVVTLVSCGGDDFKEQSKLGSLRVLAISADTPEINTDGGVTLTPLISYVDGGDTVLDFSWEACPDPGIDFGADINCNSSPAALKLSGSGTFNTNLISGTYYTGYAPDILVTIPAAAFVYLSTLDSDLQFNGVNYIVVLKYVDQADGNTVESLKRIKLSTKVGGQLNTNPTFGTIQGNNTNLTSYPSSKSNFSLSTPSSPESYELETNVGLKSFSEDMFVSWYSSSGKYEFNRTDIGENNQFTPSGVTGVFVAVYRDGRGGVTSTIVSF
jgi:hypothetical protein